MRSMAGYVVMLSAGMDSALNLLLSLEKGEVVTALTVDYGQRAALREVERSAEICRRYGVDHRVLEIPWLGDISGSALVDGGVLGGVHPVEGKPGEGIDSLWIPNRNGLFANVGACFAEALGAHFVVMGLNAEEAEEFPDNTREFVECINCAFAYSTRGKVELVSHTLLWDKERIAKELTARNFDFSLLWPCYNGGKKICGKCPSCLRFVRAAEKTGILYQIRSLFE